MNTLKNTKTFLKLFAIAFFILHGLCYLIALVATMNILAYFNTENFTVFIRVLATIASIIWAIATLLTELENYKLKNK